MSREEPPWLFSESTFPLSSAFYTPRAPHSDLHSNILGNSPEIVREHYAKWSPERQEAIDELMAKVRRLRAAKRGKTAKVTAIR
jgi:hypothetical protein